MIVLYLRMENSLIFSSPRRPLLLYHIPHRNAKEAISLRRGKKPTRKQKIRLGQAGLSPENWLVVKQKQNGELVILHKHTDTIRVVPPPGTVTPTHRKEGTAA